MTIGFRKWSIGERSWLAATVSAALVWTGCHHHRASITAVPLSPWNQCEPEGIPYYLPKPMLVVAKNVRHIDESKVGLTAPPPIPNGFDNQATYADVKANVTVPGSTGQQAANVPAATPGGQFDANHQVLPDIWEKMTPAGRVEDGTAPDSFFTYQIIFVPDLSQKYGLRIKGGPGEMRAAMNLVNGWMYTGMGPFYVKDSSTAQNMMALGVGAMYTGRGVADVLNQVGNLTKAGAASGKGAERAESVDAGGVSLDALEKLARTLQSETRVPQTMLNYAEVHIYEPEQMGDGQVGWRLVAEHRFDRHYFQPGLDEGARQLMTTILEKQVELQKGRTPQPGGGSGAGGPGAGGAGDQGKGGSGGEDAKAPNDGRPERGAQAPTRPARRDPVMERAEQQFADSMFRFNAPGGTAESSRGDRLLDGGGGTAPQNSTATSTVAAPTTDVDISINSPRHAGWGLPRLPNPFRRKDPPQQRTILRTLQDYDAPSVGDDIDFTKQPGPSISSGVQGTSLRGNPLGT